LLPTCFDESSDRVSYKSPNGGTNVNPSRGVPFRKIVERRTTG
jgi:hypothetical protein